MKLFKWNISDLKPKFPNVVEKFFGKKITDDTSHNEEVATVPSVNIADENKAFEVSVALPGLDKKDVKIEIQNDCLIISSEKEIRKGRKTKTGCDANMAMLHSNACFNCPKAPTRTRFRLK